MTGVRRVSVLVVVLLAMVLVVRAQLEEKKCNPTECPTKCCNKLEGCAASEYECYYKSCLEGNDCGNGCCDFVNSRCVPDGECNLYIKIFGSTLIGIVVTIVVSAFILCGSLCSILRCIISKREDGPDGVSLRDRLA
eukprot:TRINITY_DN6486_c0_g1_i3.p1 TRINITY_DN6486_c0_g1~~TRINITY_DN6486_c0_g1_i3.p1  ORF type:complete len:137 (-),score=10.79 TRINITY_DN6486_c0_g1_i3:103-513(-)